MEYAIRFGLPPQCLDEDDVLIPAPAASAMLDLAATELDCPDLGLRLAGVQSLSVLGPLAVAVTNAPTIGDALDCLTRYISVHSRMVTLTTEPDLQGEPGTVAVVYRPAGRSGPVQAADMGIGFTHRLITYLNRGPYSLRSVELPYQPAAPLSVHQDFFGALVRTRRRSGAALRVGTEVLSTPLRRVDDTIHQLAIAYLARRSATGSDDIVSRVRTATQEMLGTGTANLTGIAKLMTVHPRTLQRQLAAQGHPFNQILEQERRDKALRLLIGTDLPLGQIAAMVGFDEQASLSRAARHWWGVPPSRVRRERRKPASGSE
ncbi:MULTISPECIES: AraC family transcriptional regulator [Tsukamurella]|uniref:AraC family transcriptional regulator n=1 Tax=Tsukamurella columbiensis TaxID=128509 RepID=A0ABX1LF36_9ACTN|nr:MULTISPECIES: AraC family transcriptional regulator [Tsukamurella]NMD55940.1 AraC family transcriptional regulator [Tsukamurella columbiensis]